MQVQSARRQPLLSVHDLTKGYGKTIGCQNISFDVFPGEILAIVGESGSGKSTLLNSLSGRLTPDTGSVVYDLRDKGPTDILSLSEPERRRLMRTDWGLVQQNPRDGLRMEVTAGGNIGERQMAL
ncbi:ATP-binding cassette domain-containing protein, partial [Mesorhizobium delmotii]|uniref:ATP-binding cassette domain-containing protein n=1 Tax=Mesorhizobium delmotii TaxID=1631247 RepID=UPI001FCF0A15